MKTPHICIQIASWILASSPQFHKYELRFSIGEVFGEQGDEVLLIADGSWFHIHVSSVFTTYKRLRELS